ncbi:MAG: hemolysin family protein [Micromonosporaceae bacterium]
MSPSWAIVVSVVLLALNGFFVAAEFALVASKRHRLQRTAAAGSRAAQAAIAGTRELSLMLAGAQLGITLCSLGLGALAKPAVTDLLEPLLEATGLPDEAAYVISFLFALSVVVFLHMVIGEMAPKSWAISHPERSALLLALPFRAFARVSRPLLAVLNAMANACVRAVKVTPQDQLAQVHGPEELRMLLEESREHGLLPAHDHRLLTAMLTLQKTTIATVLVPTDRIVTIDAHADAGEIERTSRDTGRSRLVVRDEHGHTGIVHVRDAVRATTYGHSTTATDLATPALTLRTDRTLIDAVRAMREHRAQLALVSDNGTTVGLVALEDLLEQLIGEFDDETDPIITIATQRHHTENPDNS